MQFSLSGITRLLRSQMISALLLVLVGATAGALGMLYSIPAGANHELKSALGRPLRSGPWGEMYALPFTISPPEDVFPLRGIEEAGTHWLLRNFTEAALDAELEKLDLSTEDRTAWKRAAAAVPGRNSLVLSPPAELVMSLPARSRRELYRLAAQFPENASQFTFIHKDAIDDRFKDSGVTWQAIALFRKLSIEHGDYLVFGGLPVALARLPSYSEKRTFFQALGRQKTMFLRIRITEDSDVEEIAEYWGKGAGATNIRTFLKSNAQVPGGTFFNVMAILPPLPSSELYRFPVVPDLGPNGQPVVEDCHWTSLNFFQNKPDPELANDDNIRARMLSDYCPISGDPHYGDIVQFLKPAGGCIHTAVFIADNVVFTKNGSTVVHPWMFATVDDLLKQYSFQVPDGQRLQVRYVRDKKM